MRSKTTLAYVCVFLFSISMTALVSHNSAAESLEDLLESGRIERAERVLGPFTVEGKEFTVIIKDLKYNDSTYGFDDTVEGFSIVDQDGRVHFQRSFPVEIADGGFNESWGMGGSALDSRGLKGFRNEGGKLVEMPQKDRPGAGLVLYYGFTPSAPGTGGSCQVFAMKEDTLSPLFLPLHGNSYQLEPGSTPNSRRLFENDTMRFGEWTGWFDVVVPLKVLTGLQPVPLHYSATYKLYACDVVADYRRPCEEDTFVRLFGEPRDTSTPDHIIVRKDSEVEFIFAYTNIVIKQGTYGCSISIDRMPWVKVRIDGKEGFVRDAEDLRALGLRHAG